jgi:conjugative relaxase-like TrwC/TraI family protein
MCLVVRPIQDGVVSYYLDGRDAGRWTGRGAGLLGLGGPVVRSELTAVLQGRHPRHGGYLPERRPARRRAGWDLIFAAPKSLSLLAATQPDEAGSIAEAHRRAVDEAVGHLERRHLSVRRRGAAHGRVPSLGGIAAAFDHRMNAASEPHLHSHLLLANLAQLSDGTWGAISSGWWVSRQALSAIYQLGLRHHLEAAGWRLDWRLRPDGLADLASVPRAAVRATSSQRKATLALGRFESRRRAAPQPWRARAAEAGFGTAGPPPWRRPPGPSFPDRESPDRESPGLESPGLASAVAARLASTRSEFRETDVIVALASCHPGGATGAEAEAWTAGFCSRAVAIDEGVPGVAIDEGVPGPSRRWTTPLALRADEKVIGHSRIRASRAPTEAYEQALRQVDARHGLSPERAGALRRLMAGERTIEVISCLPRQSGLLAAAALVDACRSGWEATGQRASISARTPEDAERWRTLTGLAAYRAGDRSDVVLIDQADRRPAPELLALLSAIAGRGARAVLVEGGTLPRLVDPRSRAITVLGDALGRLAPGAAPSWLPLAADQPGLLLDATGAPRPATGTEAAAALLRWWVDHQDTAGERPLLVGLGVDEAAGLNRSARALLVRRGDVGGPDCEARGRTYQAGDRLVLYGRAGPGSPGPGGTTGTVMEVDTRRSRALVAWDRGGPASVLGRSALARAGYGYAATPGMAARMSDHRHGPVVLLGSPELVPLLQSRVLASARAVAGLDLIGTRGLEETRRLDRLFKSPTPTLEW